MNVLLTSGASFIGSHTAVELIAAGHGVVIADDLSNSSASVIERLERITGVRVPFYQIDVADTAALERLFAERHIDAVIHFAGLKAVGESVAKPLLYYRNNLDTTLALLEVMAAHVCRRFIFSSSATVYGMTNSVPFTEEMPAGGCTNLYGWTKFMIEQNPRDATDAELPRYFNSSGTHESS